MLTGHTRYKKQLELKTKTKTQCDKIILNGQSYPSLPVDIPVGELGNFHLTYESRILPIILDKKSFHSFHLFNIEQ